MVRCGPPPLTDNPTYAPVLEVYDYGGAVVYTCKSGYTLNGSRELTCSDKGSFSPAPPNCIRKCFEYYPNPTFLNVSVQSQHFPICFLEGVECEDVQILNGEVMLGSSRPPHGHKSSLTFKCSEGYTLIGSSTITCDINSQWGPGIPKCESK